VCVCAHMCDVLTEHAEDEHHAELNVEGQLDLVASVLSVNISSRSLSVCLSLCLSLFLSLSHTQHTHTHTRRQNRRQRKQLLALTARRGS
jgi:hypothetical protein